MRRFLCLLTAAVLAAALLQIPQPPASAAGPSVDEPAVPDLKILSPDNSTCRAWDPMLGDDGDPATNDSAANRQLNETVGCPWFPSLTRLANGDLYVAYSWSVSHSFGGLVAGRRSSDNGRTWSAETVIASDPTASDVKEPSLTTLRNGDLMVAYYDYKPSRPNRRKVYVKRSTDNGATWSAATTPATLAYDTTYGWAGVDGDMVELANGDLLLPIYVHRDYRSATSKFSAHVLRGRPDGSGGYTWDKADERVVMWDGDPGVVSYAEPTLADLGGGHIMMVTRTSGNPAAQVMRVSHSYDNGNTWTAPADEPSLKGHAPHMLKLRGGSHLLTYGDTSGAFAGGRPVVGRIYDPKTGWTGTQSKMIYKTPRTPQPGWAGFPSSDMSYPASVELDDGRVLTVYYDRLEGILGGTYLRPDPYRLDLWKMHLDGKATYQTDLDFRAASRPMMQPYGALDGNTTYWYSAAAGTGAPPTKTFTLALDKPYLVTDVGVVLKPGYQESARLRTSLTGSGDWQTIRNYTMQGTTAYDWTALRPGNDAKYIRAEITDTQGNGSAVLNDLAVRVAPTTFNRFRSTRLDLRQMLLNGQAGIGGNLTYLDPAGARPGINPSGPIDGKADYWYAAAGTCSSCAGTWQISLDQPYQLNKVGLMLKPGYQESAVVETSPNGTTWTQVAGLTMADTAQTQYLTFTPVTAKHVRVRITHVSAGQPQLAEAELFTTTPTTQP
ncbi:discoidin domain-containing protein [Actinomadura rubrisoli]|uniref:F5/8 type C domain-containing protein n=1 Tax=Actinomadura rubrisoli TaxID=2530368 RepID=A0A4V2YZB1_9ACTN|nr:discoidin domain-containing protein [Actinomadura rubrisoli]TDD96417.1 hypothetical protein E1298_02965 [Actinomadura rubrisoli]